MSSQPIPWRWSRLTHSVSDQSGWGAWRLGTASLWWKPFSAVAAVVEEGAKLHLSREMAPV